MPKRTSAFSRALQEAQSDSITVPQQERETVSPSHSPITVSPQNREAGFSGETVKQSHRETAQHSHSETGEEERVIKTSFYPTQGQLDKLDDLASEYNRYYRRQRARINRNDIVRYLIDQCTLDSLTDLR